MLIETAFDAPLKELKNILALVSEDMSSGPVFPTYLMGSCGQIS